MSQSIASPSPLASLRQTCLRLWDDRDTRSAIVGVIGMLLVHLLLFLLAPHLLRTDDSASVMRPHSSTQQFDIQLPSEEVEETPPANFEYLHQGSSNEGQKYAIGKYTSKAGSYRVFVVVKQARGSYRIDTIDFTKE